MNTIYLDYNATTPIDPEVRDIIVNHLQEPFGNPSSVHREGRKARALLDDARHRVSTLLHCRPSEIVFTSGGSESVNLAILGTARALKSRGTHLITSAIEHHAVLDAFRYLANQEGFALTVLPVDSEGRVDPAELHRRLTPQTTLVSVMAANNEVGSIQAVADIGRICRSRGVIFHTDAVQWFGKMPVGCIEQFQADLVSACGHKLHGPKGIGLLYIRSPLQLHPIHFGGGQENEKRPGTENLSAILGFVRALEKFVRRPVFDKDQLNPLSRRLENLAEQVEGVQVCGGTGDRLCNTVSFIVEGADSTSLLASLDLEGICASSGSACSAGALTPSHVLRAMGFDEEKAGSLIRFSLGRETTATDIETVLEILPQLIHRIRSGRKTGRNQVESQAH